MYAMRVPGFIERWNAARGGQSILVIVLVLGATMLGATTIAGYVSLQKIRAATDIIDSTRAVYAADAGIEWCLYYKFNTAVGDSSFRCDSTVNNPMAELVFPESRASVGMSDDGVLVKSVGNAGDSYRAFGFSTGP